ncbi:MAG: MMPL family transporter [Gordonia sp. (in: high G+C Gram-positive bacteria)]
MFGSIGTFVYRMRYTVIAVLVALMGGLGLYGLDLPKYLSQSGWFDPSSESVRGSEYADTALGRDHKSDIILLITPPAGTKVDDPAFGKKIETIVDDLIKAHPNIISRDSPTDPSDTVHAGLIDPFANDNPAAQKVKRDRMFTKDLKHGFISIGVRGNDDTSILANYKEVAPFFDDLAGKYDLPGTEFQLAGLQPVAGAMSLGMEQDIHRAEVIALPVVALMLLFVFGGVVAAVLPVFIGGLTIAGSLGIMKILAQVTELNIFAQSVVTLIGLGIAIDYGLFMVSRYREELAEGYTVEAAVRRAVMTSGQTIAFSATIIIAALACLLMFPQSFLKSVAYGAIFSVLLAAILSITVLPAILAILGKRIDALSVPFLNRTRTREEIENGFWGKLSGWVMQHPLKTAIPTVLLLLALIIPFGNIAFGGISEKYLPPDNTSRQAQESFDKYFPAERTEELKLIILSNQDDEYAADKIQKIADEANKIPGFTKEFSPRAEDGALDGILGSDENGLILTQMSAGLVDRNTAGEAIEQLRAIDPQGMKIYVAGMPALTQDSIDALMVRLPWMAILLVLVTGLLMFLAFGSVILPIKAALMSALGLGSTLGILTWIFIDGHGSSIANFTPGPLFAPMLVLVIAIVYGLSTDYEIFLLSRMVEARQQGASTTEAVRTGTAHTGRLITAAAAILVVVTGAFGLSEIVMMKYIAFGMIAALILDATVIRMLLVPSVMKLLGDDCWWAPAWMLKLQQKIGLGETILHDNPADKVTPVVAAGTVSAGGVVAVAEADTALMKAQAPRTGRAKAGNAEPQRLRKPAKRGRRTNDDAPDSGPIDSGPIASGPIDVCDADSGPLNTASPDSGPVPAAPAAAPPVRTPAGRPPQRTPEGHLNDLIDAPDAAAVAAERRAREQSGPDTGSWRLGPGGVIRGTGNPAASNPTVSNPAVSNPAVLRPNGSNPAMPVAQPGGPGANGPRPQGPQGPRPVAPGQRPGPAQQGPVAPRRGPAQQQPPVQQQPVQQGPAPQAPAAQQPVQPPAAPPRRATSAPSVPLGHSPLTRQPNLDEPGRRPLAASPDPTAQVGPARPDTESANGKPGRSASPRKSRQARTSESQQISVQDLLRRSRSQQSDD